jgi:WD40 repeat protein
VAGYEVLGELGRGGMGVVYKARHLRLKRLVALKMILAGEHADAHHLARFKAEAEAVARLQHPNIVQIYEIGEQDGLPYFALEYIDGGSLAAWLRRGPLAAPEAARLVETLARGMFAAHQNGTIHRDLKPANVLLAFSDASQKRPAEKRVCEALLNESIPKITDFGLAKQTDSGEAHTQEGAVLGTPSYMAPEQASGKVGEVGPASDVYALGAILYECLTGRPPFRAATAVDTIMQVVSKEPVPPARLQPGVPRDLETICLTCLRKEPAKRYASALDLAEDLRRFQANEPIRARPAGALERLRKWSRRHPGVAALSVLIVLVSVAAFGLVTWFWLAAARQAEQARQARREAVHKADDEARARGEAETQRNIAEGHAADSARRKEQAEQQLERTRQLAFTAQLWRAAALLDRDPVLALQVLDDRGVCPPERRDFAWRYDHRLAQRLTRRSAQQQRGIQKAAVSPNGALLAAVTAEGRIRLWDLNTGKAGADLPGHTGPAHLHTLTFSPDSKTLASGGADGQVRLWEVPAGKLAATLSWRFSDKATRWVLALAFHPNGRTLAAGGTVRDLAKARTDSDSQWGKPVIWLWDVPGRTGKMLAASPAYGRSQPQLTGYRIEDSGVNSLAYSPDGKTLAVGMTRLSSVLVLDAATGQEQQRFRTEAGWIGGMVFSPDGTRLAYGNSTSNVFVCDLVARKVLRTLYGHLGHVGSLLWTSDGALISGANDGTVRIWEAGTGQLRTTLRCQTGIKALRLLRGNRQLLAVTGREAQLWEMAVPAPATLRAPQAKDKSAGSSALAFDQDGARLAVAGQDAIVRLWNPAPRTVALSLTGHKKRTTAVAFGPPGSGRLISGDEAGKVFLWQIHESKPPQPVVLAGHTKAVTCLAVTPDGTRVFSGSVDGTVRLWDAASGQAAGVLTTGHGQVQGLALSDDGQRLLTGGSTGSLCIWDVKERKLVQTIPPLLKGRIDQLAVTREGRTAAIIVAGAVALYDLGSKGTARPRLVTRDAWSVAFTPDSRTLAVGGGDRVVRLYDVVSGHFRGELPGHSHQVVALAFNRDATLLATASRGGLRWDHKGEVKLWAAPLPENEPR